MTDDKKKLNPIVLVGSHQLIGSYVAKHLGDMGVALVEPEKIEPIKIQFSENYGLPLNALINEWGKSVLAIRMFGGYRYLHVRIVVATKKERKHKNVPRFLERIRGEEMFPLPFHRDNWGDVYFPKPINPVFD